MTRAKIVDGGVRREVVGRLHCQLRVDSAQADASDPTIRTLLYTQLLGLALGLPAQALGLEPSGWAVPRSGTASVTRGCDP
jgi:hypothetical protein